MTQVTDPITRALTGLLPFILFLAAVLALPISISLLRLYRRAVLRSMRTRASLSAIDPAPIDTSAPAHRPMPTALDFTVLDRASPITTGPAAGALYSEVLRAPWRAAAIYVAAGSCHALFMTAALFAAGKIELYPIRLLLLFWTHAWPVVLTVNLVAASTRRAKLATTFVYFLTLAALSAIALARSTTLSWGQMAVLWPISNLLETVLLVAFLNRRVRAVGPLVLTFMVVAFTGSMLAFSIVVSNEGLLAFIVNHVVDMGFSAYSIFFGLVVLGFAVLAPAGWLTLRWIRGWYERKKISDQSITLDAIWLLFGAGYSIALVFEGAAWIFSGLLAFVVYKVVAWTGFSLLDRRARPTRKRPMLLLLRVFSLGRRSERLFEALTKHWRHVGSIQFIAGPDLATTTVEPHEFLDFVSGKLARRFIDGPETLDLRIAEMDLEPDQDGRFRVNDFFCHDNTWKMVLSRLVSESDVLLMDLRGFSPQNAGCVFEINELINVVHLERVVFIVDDTTDEQFLRQNVQQSWNQMRSTSPNWLSTSGQVRLFRFTRWRGGELQQLLRALCVAAEAA